MSCDTVPLSFDNLTSLWRDKSLNLRWDSVFVLPLWLKAWWHEFGAGLEEHMLAVRENGKIAVLGVLIREGDENATIQTILENMPHTAEEDNADTGITIDPLSLLPQNRKDYYSLAGSLTTPPCSEGVDWYVLAEPITVSASQLDQLKVFYSGNARDIQDLNGRSVSRKNMHNH